MLLPALTVRLAFNLQVTPQLTSAEQSKRLLLSPPTRQVTVGDAPVLDAHFSQVSRNSLSRSPFV